MMKKREKQQQKNTRIIKMRYYPTFCRKCPFVSIVNLGDNLKMVCCEIGLLEDLMPMNTVCPKAENPMYI